MEEMELSKYLGKIDPVDLLIRAKETRKMVEKGDVEDAIAYALAAGSRLGIKAAVSCLNETHSAEKAAAEPQPALTKECIVKEIVAGYGSFVPVVELMFFDKEFKVGDKVIVQIRKKEE